MLPPKPGESHASSSYKPISLSPMISNFSDKSVIKRLGEIVIEKNFVPEYQFRFRSLHSTNDQTYRIINKVVNAFKEKISNNVVFKLNTDFRHCLSTRIAA